MQVLDDAIYALDGMAPTCGLGTQRESVTKLAELLSTRRGRAALRCGSACGSYLCALDCRVDYCHHVLMFITRHVCGGMGSGTYAWISPE